MLLFIFFAQARDIFSDFSRPAVTFALRLLGIGAVDHGASISAGRIDVPWSRDCAGLNLLLVLVALAVWVNRSEPAGRVFFAKLALTVPAALLANVLRVLTLIGYRHAFYPNVESPQLHYFLGFAWLLPFLPVFLPRGRPLLHVLLEAMQAASAIALLIPMTGTPGGQTGAVAALIALSQCSVQRDFPQRRFLLTISWMLLALGIALLGMESFWLPWLLTCPLLVPRRWILGIPGAVLTAAAHPLFGMIPGAVAAAWGAVGLLWWKGLGQAETEEADGDVKNLIPPGKWRLPLAAAAVFFILPFVASVIFARERRSFLPPAHAAFTAIGGDAYDVRIPGQPDNVGLVWFNPSGNGRHHSMKVCMKYRGVELEPSHDCADVSTDGQRWMREFYLLDGRLVPGYASYVVRTFRPLSSPGVHLIFVAKCDLMSATAFDESCRKLAPRLEAGADPAAGTDLVACRL